MSASKLTWRQMQIALIPVFAAIVCFVLAVAHCGGPGGSALWGYVQNGRYFLSGDRDRYFETTRERFEETKHREEVICSYLSGMVLSLLIAVILVKVAGKSPMRTLHPPPNAPEDGT